MADFINIFMPLQNPELILIIAVGVFLGIYIGAIPGLSVTMAVSLLISFTFSWDVLPAIALMIGIHVGGVYGGSRSAILLNIPGAPAAVATTLDGYPLAKKGLAGKALGITVVYSFLGGVIGSLILAVGASEISKIALEFDARDYFMLALTGLLLVGTIGGGTSSKGIMSVALGIIIGCIGIDFETGMQRFTYGSVHLMTGVSYVAVMIGLFGLSEVFVQMRDQKRSYQKQIVDRLLPRKQDILKYLPLSVKTSMIGAVIGALPGTGGDIAALFAYGFAKNQVKNPEVPFGEGAIEGLVAPESANNAACPGSYIPLLTLGIPGDAVTAIIIGALSIHGLSAGPTLLSEHGDIFWLIVGGMLIANLFLLIFGFMGIRLFAKIVDVPKEILMPIIVLLTVIGSYTISNNVMEVAVMLIFGIVGYFLKNFNYPVAPMVLGIILCDTIDKNYRRLIRQANNEFVGFLKDLFSHKISLIITVILIITLLSQSGILKKIIQKLKGERDHYGRKIQEPVFICNNKNNDIEK